MRSPPAAKTVFVAWDHSVDEHQAELPALIRGAGTHHTYTARCAGGDDPDGPISEDLCSDIRQTDCLLAFLERPNCNVMFEAGFALGVGRPIYLRVYSQRAGDGWNEAVAWLKGFTIKPLEDAEPPSCVPPKLLDLADFFCDLSGCCWAGRRAPVCGPSITITRKGLRMNPGFGIGKGGVGQAAKTAVVKKRRKRMPIEKLALGLYVAEPDGIWTPIGTVSEKRISEYRVRRKPRKP